MNAKDSRRTDRIAHAEYTDARGYTHTEYKDAQGNIYTEYTDARGNVHTYKNSYANGHLAEERRQAERESRAGSNGLLAGILISCVGLIALGTIYALTRPEEVQELPPVVNVETPAPTPAEQQAEQPNNVTIVPVTPPSAEPTPTPTPQPNPQQPAATPQQPSNVNVTVTNPQGSQNPQQGSQPAPSTAAPTTATPPQTSAPQTPAAQTPSSQTPETTDASLKADITKKFQDSLPNNTLMTTVNNGEVTVTGTVTSQEQLQQISTLLSSVTGIKKVTNNATVAQ